MPVPFSPQKILELMQQYQMQDNDPADTPHDWRQYDYNTPAIHPGGQINLLPTRSDMPVIDPYELPEGEQRWVPRRYPGGRS